MLIPVNGNMIIAQNDPDNLVDKSISKIQESLVQISSIGPKGSTTGSGWINNDKGYIITDYELVAGSKNINVTFHDGAIFNANLLGTDLWCGIGWLEVNGLTTDRIIPLSLSNSKELQPGEQVFALGVGESGQGVTITEGITKDESFVVPAGAKGTPYPIADIILTDAPMDPLSIGGPLLNSHGNVVGMNTFFSVPNEKIVQNLGFAIPSNTIEKVSSSLINTGHFKHPWLGIGGTDVVRAIPNSNYSLGAVVITNIIPDSPSNISGLKEGDIILKVNNSTITGTGDLLNYIQREIKSDDLVNITIVRDNDVYDLKMVAKERPDVQFLM